MSLTTHLGRMIDTQRTINYKKGRTHLEIKHGTENTV